MVPEVFFDGFLGIGHALVVHLASVDGGGGGALCDATTCVCVWPVLPAECTNGKKINWVKKEGLRIDQRREKRSI